MRDCTYFATEAERLIESEIREFFAEEVGWANTVVNANKLDRLIDKVTKYYKEIIAAQETELDTLEDECERLERENGELQQEVEELEDEIDELKESLVAYRLNLI